MTEMREECSFEVFNRGTVPAAGKPYVTLHRRGTLTLNAEAMRMMDGVHYVQLMYDRKHRVVGLKPEFRRTDTNYELRQQFKNGKKYNNMLLSLQAFCRYYGISTEETRRFVPYLEGELLCFDLDRGVLVGGSAGKES